MRRISGVSIAIVVAAMFIACWSRAQSTAPGQAPHISERDRIRLAEAFRLGEALQEEAWTGWSEAPFAVLLVTQECEFLLRHAKPGKEFTSAGYDPMLRTEVYYRKRVFPTNLLATFPAVAGISTIVIGQAENTSAKNSTRWVVTLLHEHFHQWQDSRPGFFEAVNALGLARGDTSGMWMMNFPFPYKDAQVAKGYAALTQALAAALDARGTPQFSQGLAAYRAARNQFVRGLTPDDAKYLAFQAWKEGVARYTEYRIGRLAAEHSAPGEAFRALDDFRPYSANTEATLENILRELREPDLAGIQRVAFYALGAGEALLLDAARPGWRSRYQAERFSLEGLWADGAGSTSESMSGTANFHGYRLAVAFAALGEPFGQCRRQTRRLHTEAGLDAALGERQGVVEFSRAGKVAHAEGVEPFERAGAALAADENIDLEFAGVHTGRKYSSHAHG